MTAVTRKTLWATFAFLALSLTACPTPVKPDGGTVDAGNGECVDDTDCLDPLYFFCNTVTTQCEQSCRSAAQCKLPKTPQSSNDFESSFCGVWKTLSTLSPVFRSPGATGTTSRTAPREFGGSR